MKSEQVKNWFPSSLVLLIRRIIDAWIFQSFHATEFQFWPNVGQRYGFGCKILCQRKIVYEKQTLHNNVLTYTKSCTKTLDVVYLIVVIIGNLILKISPQMLIDVHFFIFSSLFTGKNVTFDPCLKKIPIGEQCHTDGPKMT